MSDRAPVTSFGEQQLYRCPSCGSTTDHPWFCYHDERQVEGIARVPVQVVVIDPDPTAALEALATLKTAMQREGIT